MKSKEETANTERSRLAVARARKAAKDAKSAGRCVVLGVCRPGSNVVFGKATPLTEKNPPSREGATDK
jgi:hypothetical protein